MKKDMRQTDWNNKKVISCKMGRRDSISLTCQLCK